MVPCQQTRGRPRGPQTGPPGGGGAAAPRAAGGAGDRRRAAPGRRWRSGGRAGRAAPGGGRYDAAGAVPIVRDLHRKLNTTAREDHPMSDSTPTDAPLTVLVYSDDRAVRAEVRRILGRKVAADLPEIEVVECATQPAVIAAFDGGDIDLGILDGEAVPSGGMGLCRQLKDELAYCPPIMLLRARGQAATAGAPPRRARPRRGAP